MAENINDPRHVALPQIAFRLKGHNKATQLLYTVRSVTTARRAAMLGTSKRRTLPTTGMVVVVKSSWRK